MPDTTRWFRRLLRLLPADFQADYSRDMERTFRAQQREARTRGIRAVAALWWETAVDVLRTAPRQHAEQASQDVRYALRMMARRPAIHGIAAAVFAVGIAATTAIFSIVDAALLRPIPYEDPGALVAVRERTPQDPQPWELSYVAFTELQRGARSFERLAAHMKNGVMIRAGERMPVMSALVSASLFETLRVHPAAGRSFTADEDAPGGPAVAVISEELARARFGSAEKAVGQAIVIDDRSTTVIGVLDRDFRFPDAEVQVWLPIGQLADEPWMRNRAVHTSLVVGRLRPSVTITAAQAELSAWMKATQAREPAADPHHDITVRPLASHVSANARPAVGALVGAVLLLLVVTCSSVGLLLLTRVAGRANEIAVRLSVGASRARLARQLLTESMCLAAVGGLCGMLGARFLVAFLTRGLADALPPLVVPSIDVSTIAAATLITAAAAVLCGLAPAATALSGSRSLKARPDRSRSFVVAAQVAVSCVLVVIAVLLARSLDRLLDVDLGFRSERLLVMRVISPVIADPTPGMMTRFYQTVSARLRALPGVQAVTVVNSPPVQSGGFGDLTIEGQPRIVAPTVSYRRVLPGYFGVLGIPLLEGRDFNDRDGSVEPVIIVSSAVARRFWPPGQAVGKRIKVGPADREEWQRIIGVAGDVRNRSLEDAPDLATYEPHLQRPWNGMFVMARTTGAPEAFTNTARRALRELEPEVVISDVSTMEERIAESVAPRRFHTIVVGAFAVATLVLVALALYGVLASSVSSRTREIGIRSAVGASAAMLTRGVVVEGLRPTIAGLVAGLLGGVTAASAIRALLFEITPADISTYAAAAAALLAVAVASSWLPARRAARIDPSVALRSER